MRVVLTREHGYNESLRAVGPDGAEVVEVALTETAYFERDEVARSLAALDVVFETLVVTSARAEPYLRLTAGVLDTRAEVYSVGAATTRALLSYGLEVTGEAAHASIELSGLITRGPVLLLGAKAMRDELGEALDKRGLRIERVACYETVPVLPDAAGAAALRDAQVVFIGAPSAWRVAQVFIATSTWVVAPGPTTAAVVRAQHERVLEGWEPSLRDTLASLER